MDIEVELDSLSRQPFCLWVGAGIPRHLGQCGGATLPLWSEIVDRLEAVANLKAPASSTYPARLEVALSTLGRRLFQRELRQLALIPLATAILEAKRKMGTAIPDELRALAQLAYLANPIVNFNIETLSSEALGCGGGRWNHVSFQAPVPDSLSGWVHSHTRGAGSGHLRSFYHPHGAIDMTGISVMAEREYNSMAGTLALQLAVHSAFGVTLAIVGMSLEDQYLREQVKGFRHQIQRVLWFNEKAPPPEIERWAYEARVEIVLGPWADFWTAVRKKLPPPPEIEFEYDWSLLVKNCLRQLENPIASMLNQFPSNEIAPEMKADFLHIAAMRGEG